MRDLVVCGIPAPETGDLPDMYFDLASQHSFRPVGGDDGRPKELIVLGEHYRPGEEVDVQGMYESLAGWAAGRLGINEISHRWSAQDVSTPDGIPFVGRYHRGARHLWVGTGFGQWGMTGGTAAGLLLADLIADTAADNERALFDPHRFDLRSIPALARGSGVVARHLVVDMARASLTAATQDLGRDQGRYAGWALRWSRHSRTGMGWSMQYQPTAPIWDACSPSTTRRSRGTAPATPRGSISTEPC